MAMMRLVVLYTGIALSALSCVAQELSGFIDISGSRPQTPGSKIFYWFTPQQVPSGEPKPLLLWLQGGPGSPGELGLFFELGPYYLNENEQLEPRTVGNWNREYNVLFVDQPIGTGYSVAGSGDAYAKNQDEVAQDLYYFMQEWFNQHEEYANVPFFITGESYGGHYIPSFAYKILSENQNAVENGKRVIHLQGVAIGDGLTDPCSQVEAGPRAAYDFGIIDAKTFAAAKVSALKASVACLQRNYTAAHDYRSEMEDLVISSSGINKYDVRTFEDYDYMHERMDTFLNSPEAKDMLHVPQDIPFSTDSQVSIALYDDVMQSQADKIPFLLDNIRVLLYQGQFDWKDGPFSNEKWIMQMDWPGRGKYLSAPRRKWLTEYNGATHISGWVQEYDTLTEIVVNGAGHLAPMNEPERLYEMISTFIESKAFLTAT
mmetsp:Transcript_3117/g.4808  ORF Transcript_3117/g.4808 Transcript_3117/m.4808 type:complete len:431 (+) Transcript_3117:79-1371(+)|eukprot:CAMPEP_0185019382 /NCGR_PEP_ID=MMETSP1103-20130426/1993_1 /TAXON_ID=36769 /ORGANISM="Paraphysomonas bandaiensis, Strain Caron Lab Isolate" /LENGTH=430 /DNA_ID=CAMNT_0027549667 /DNA_START=79 /DNA_END=1371 /DNA_ORIENTATION=-